MGLISSKEKAKEDLKVQIQDFNDRLQIALVGCGQAKTTFTTLSDLWTMSRQETIVTLSSAADEINRNHLNVNIASLAGTTSSIAGGTSALASLILAPISGGASVALAAGALFGTVAGSATTLGANVTEVLLTKNLLEKVKEVLETDAMYTKALGAAFHELVIHENEVIAILVELQEKSLAKDLEKVAKLSPYSSTIKDKVKQLKDGSNSLQDILALVSCLYSEDGEFLRQLKMTDVLFSQIPNLSTTLPTTSEFFQALKELSTLGPETLKSITGAALQTSAATGTQAASLGAQIVTAGLGAVFIALDTYNLIKTKQNYDEGSKTELAQKMTDVVINLLKEQEQVKNLSNFYKQRSKTLDQLE